MPYLFFKFFFFDFISIKWSFSKLNRLQLYFFLPKKQRMFFNLIIYCWFAFLTVAYTQLLSSLIYKKPFKNYFFLLIIYRFFFSKLKKYYMLL